MAHFLIEFRDPDARFESLDTQAKSRDKFGDLECNLLSKYFVHPPLVARDKMKVQVHIS